MLLQKSSTSLIKRINEYILYIENCGDVKEQTGYIFRYSSCEDCFNNKPTA